MACVNFCCPVVGDLSVQKYSALWLQIFSLMLQDWKQRSEEVWRKTDNRYLHFNIDNWNISMAHSIYLYNGQRWFLNLSMNFCDTGRHGRISGSLWSVEHFNCFISFSWPTLDLYLLIPFPSLKMEIQLSAKLTTFCQAMPNKKVSLPKV